MKNPQALKKKAVKNLQSNLNEYLERSPENVTEFAARLGRTRQYIYKILSDPDFNPSLENICTIAAAIEVEPSDLLK